MSERQFPRDFPNVPPFGYGCAVYLDGRRVTRDRPKGMLCFYADESSGVVDVAIKGRDGKIAIDRENCTIKRRRLRGAVRIIDWDYRIGMPPHKLQNLDTNPEIE